MIQDTIQHWDPNIVHVEMLKADRSENHSSAGNLCRAYDRE